MPRASVGIWTFSHYFSQFRIGLFPELKRIFRQNLSLHLCQKCDSPQQLGRCLSSAFHQFFHSWKFSKSQSHLALAKRIQESHGCLSIEFCTVTSESQGSPPVPAKPPATMREAAYPNIPSQYQQDTSDFPIHAHRFQAALVIGADGCQKWSFNDSIHKGADGRLKTI